ncbi:MAG: phosphoglycerate mutase family protein [Anaerolineales bacterium]
MDLTQPTLYLARHATPDWTRTDLSYHIPPGPPLVPQGEDEAAQLGRFFRTAGLARIWASPLERAHRTAAIAAGVAEVTVQVDEALAEWRPEEKAEHIRARFWPAWERAIALSLQVGPIALVTHGGPIGFFLDELGLPKDTLAYFKRTFDRNNPAPPGGAWKLTRPASGEPWDLVLAFVPEVYRKKLVV